MENVILIVHLILALCLIGIVLLQRSEGGGLGMSGGGVMTGRAAATAMGKLTWMLAIGFIVTSMTLTILAAAKTDGASVVDRIPGATAPAEPTEPAAPQTPAGGADLLPPAPAGDEPLVPRAAE
ncbi:MAG: preprotein translocase subunit SecG [Tropicimonas sp.]|uniref:preprotein translocase subunit SecG n=1 Tax=Tropicimonas sp. TaxID=2067044 RepID=UPI003A89CFB5